MPPLPIRVLIVDDSAVVRRILSDLVSEDPCLEVAAIAQNGSIALQKMIQTKVDIVVLDLEMPVMDGIECLERLRAEFPTVPVLMCSSATARGADATLRALAAGAADYVAKPSALRATETLASFGAELRAKLKALTNRDPKATHSRPPLATAGVQKTTARSLATKPITRRGRPRLLAIGCSTGGPNALAQIFAVLPPDLGVPIVVTQHMPPVFTRLLAERLSAKSALCVHEAQTDDRLEPNHAYLAPGDYHMAFTRDKTDVRVQLNQDPPEHSCRPAVDVMFRSAAHIFGGDVVAVVLTGMGRDGALGSRAIAEAGGWIITQDAASCIVPSMPNAVTELGAANETIELDLLGAHLASRCGR